MSDPLWPHGLYVAHQALSTEFSRQKYWSGYPFPSPEIFLTQRLNPGPQHAGRFFANWAPRGFNSVLQVPLLQQPGNPISAFLAQQGCVCNAILLSHKKDGNPDVYNNMNVSREYHTNRSKSEKDIQKVSLICGISKYRYKWTHLQNRNRLTDIENKVMVTKGEKIRTMGLIDRHDYI